MADDRYAYAHDGVRFRRGRCVNGPVGKPLVAEWSEFAVASVDTMLREDELDWYPAAVSEDGFSRLEVYDSFSGLLRAVQGRYR